MLDKLSQSQLEQAFLFLQYPSSQPLPKELEELNELEWLLLSQMLERLLLEKKSHPLQ